MWRRTSESKPSLSSPEPPAPPAIPVARPVPAPPVVAEPRQPKSLLGHEVTLKGELAAREDVTIDGVFEGQIRVAGAGLTIGANGRVTAEAEADEIVVEGCYQGSLRARERVSLRRTASVTGGIETPRLVIEDGAILRGRVDMTQPGEAPAAHANAAAAPRVERAAFPRVPVHVTESAS